MAWNYSGDPSTSSKDGVRFLVGDTDSNDPQLQDAEILFLISQYTNIWKSAAYAARSIASKYARQISKAVGDLKLEYQQRQTAYTEMSRDFLKQAATRTSLPFAGGISKADQKTDRLNPDLKQFVFTKNLFHYPGADAGPNGPGNPEDASGGSD